eukprot:5002026-Heterocapsa_arctica.AAC.1
MSKSGRHKRVAVPPCVHTHPDNARLAAQHHSIRWNLVVDPSSVTLFTMLVRASVIIRVIFASGTSPMVNAG